MITTLDLAAFPCSGAVVTEAESEEGRRRYAAVNGLVGQVAQHFYGVSDEEFEVSVVHKGLPSHVTTSLRCAS